MPNMIYSQTYDTTTNKFTWFLTSDITIQCAVGRGVKDSNEFYTEFCSHVACVDESEIIVPYGIFLS